MRGHHHPFRRPRVRPRQPVMTCGHRTIYAHRCSSTGAVCIVSAACRDSCVMSSTSGRGPVGAIGGSSLERTTSGVPMAALPHVQQRRRVLVVTIVAALALSVEAVRNLQQAAPSAIAAPIITTPAAITDTSSTGPAVELQQVLAQMAAAADVPAASNVIFGNTTAMQQARSDGSTDYSTPAPSSDQPNFRTANVSDWGLRSSSNPQPMIGPAVPRAQAGYTPNGQGYMVYEKPPNRNKNADTYTITLDGMDAMVNNKGYTLQRHITYSDGYKLVTFRIPYGAQGPSGPARPSQGAARHPVILLHGISLSSTCWVVNGPRQSLGFILADQGYDVWMINTRGNTFSREHERYSSSDGRFWRFAMDELAQADLPSVITYIRSVTGAAKVSLVGHSQGGTIATAMLTRDNLGLSSPPPVSLMVNLAPVVFVTYMQSPMMASFCMQTNNSIALSNAPPGQFVFMGESIQSLFLNGLCQQPLVVPACRGATEALFGISYHITMPQYKRYWMAWPSATSVWNSIQWSELYATNPPEFREFRGGPEYDLTKIKVPVVMVSGGNDVLSAPKDVALTTTRFRQGGSLVGTYHVRDYSHMDFIWDTGAATKLYPAILAALDKYRNT